MYFHPKLYNGCDYLSILGVRLMYISKPAPDGGSQNGKVLIGWIVMGLESVPRVPTCYEINCSELSIFNNNKTIYFLSAITLHRCHIERGDVSKDRRLDCLLNRFFPVQIKENIKAPRHWPL